jgi:hypothetical protein
MDVPKLVHPPKVYPLLLILEKNLLNVIGRHSPEGLKKG